MNDVQRFSKLIKDIKFAMLTTINETKDTMHSRPMTLQQLEFEGQLWFFAGRDSELVEQIEKNSSVNLSFANPKSTEFVSVSGLAEVVFDKAKAEELWNPLYKAWFPEGLEDPNLCLLKVHVTSADYWESPSSKLVTLTGFAKAIMTGKRADSTIGKHGHLDL